MAHTAYMLQASSGVVLSTFSCRRKQKPGILSKWHLISYWIWALKIDSQFQLVKVDDLVLFIK